MENYLEKLNEEYGRFHQETLTKCYKAKKLIESNLDMKVRIYPSVAYLGNDKYQKSICVDIIENTVDYRTVEIGIEHINARLFNIGMSFEEAVYQEFIFTLTYENKRIKEYKGNTWEKLLDCYIRDTNCFPDGCTYYLDNEHNLLKEPDDDVVSDDGIYVVNTDSIESILFENENIVINCKKDEEDDFDIVFIGENGIKKYKKSEYKKTMEEK